jgi:hypothetical protein
MEGHRHEQLPVRGTPSIMRLYGPGDRCRGEPGFLKGWLIGVGFRLTLAFVTGAGVLAVAWPLCNQLARLGVGASSVVAGVLAVAALGVTLRMTRPEHPHVRDLRSAHVEPEALGWQVDPRSLDVPPERAARSGVRGRKLPDKSATTGRASPQARNVSARERVRTLIAQNLQFVVDDDGIQVRRKRRTVGSEVWEEHLRVQWPAVRAAGFATSAHDHIVALYAWSAAGESHHVADSRSLSQLQWTQLGELISEATRGRLTFDAAGRYDPRSIWPDW